MLDSIYNITQKIYFEIVFLWWKNCMILPYINNMSRDMGFPTIW